MRLSAVASSAGRYPAIHCKSAGVVDANIKSSASAGAELLGALVDVPGVLPGVVPGVAPGVGLGKGFVPGGVAVVCGAGCCVGLSFDSCSPSQPNADKRAQITRLLQRYRISNSRECGTVA